MSSKKYVGKPPTKESAAITQETLRRQKQEVRDTFGAFNVRLVPVRKNPAAADVLWDLLAERPENANISHTSMPTREEHEAFVSRYAYRAWFIIMASRREPTSDGERMPVVDSPVGAVYLTYQNEIGVSIFANAQRHGFGAWAVARIVEDWRDILRRDPLNPRAKPYFRANVNPDNEASKRLFEKLGFEMKCLTYTYAVEFLDHAALAAKRARRIATMTKKERSRRVVKPSESLE